MRIGILGDVHSNLEALDAVLERLQSEHVDHLVQVGDIVGYGADPVACVDRIRHLECIVCMGNHDAAVVGYLPTDYFNPYARAAIRWTRDQLGEKELEYLLGLPLTVEHQEYSLAHGSLHLPEQFGYVFSKVEAAESLAKQRTRVGFVGHSHVPAVYRQRRGAAPLELDVLFEPEIRTSLDGYERALMNVGSVGQPRDEDPRAAYGVFDTATGEIRIERVSYDIETAQGKIRAAGLPTPLADRLAIGL